MRSKIVWLSMLLSTMMVLAPFAGAQDPEQDDVRGAFLTSRPKAADKPAKSTATTKTIRRRPKTVKPANDGGGTKPVVAGEPVTPDKDPRLATSRLGLGLTLFMRDSNGLAVRVDPNHEFQKGDRVRVLLETNADGHLYIFNTTNGGDPVMIYPDPQLDEAGNYIKSHVPFEIPSSVADEERLRWFTFDGAAGTERLYFVFSREPLNGVPIEDDLLKYCAQNKTQCAWHPATDFWTSLQKEMEAPSRADNSHKFGKAQTVTEQEAATRGIGLAREDAEPTMVIMTAASGPGMLVTALELLHK
jgi:hypothetical protein